MNEVSNVNHQSQDTELFYTQAWFRCQCTGPEQCVDKFPLENTPVCILISLQLLEVLSLNKTHIIIVQTIE